MVFKFERVLMAWRKPAEVGPRRWVVTELEEETIYSISFLRRNRYAILCTRLSTVAADEAKRRRKTSGYETLCERVESHPSSVL